MQVHSSQVASFLGTVHHEYVFTVEEALDALPDAPSLIPSPHVHLAVTHLQVIYHLETFDVTTVRASTPMYLMARRIRRGTLVRGSCAADSPS